MLRERASMRVSLFEGSLMGGGDAPLLPEASSPPANPKVQLIM
jgi:hypothetical protein